MAKNLIIVVLVMGVAALGYLYFVAPPKTPVVTAPIAGEESEICAQVITPARNPETGEIREFPTPCDVPEGWEEIENDIPTLDLELQ